MKTTLFILMMLSLVISTSCAQKDGLAGKVSDDQTGQPISNASITVIQNGKYIATTYSSYDGRFFFKSIASGIFQVKIEAKDYISETRNDVELKAKKLTYLDVKLKSLVTITEKEKITTQKNINKEKCDELSAVKSLEEATESMVAARCAKMAFDNAGYQQFNTESYDKINENTFKDAINNPLSTFSIDVDKASYSNVRRFLSQNMKPYKDAVRIEEMINYFDYSYPQPKNGDPFSVSTELAQCPWNSKHNIMMIGIKGEDVSEEKIPAGNLVFLLDVSGSMEDPNKLPLLKQSFKILVDKLRPCDKVSIVVYAGAAGIVLEPTSGSNKSKIMAALDLLQAGGSTAGGAGINLAYKVAKENFIKGGNNRVILATDGDFNIGSSSDGEMVRLIEEKRKDGIFLTILGFGMGNYKDSKMEKIADAGDGNNYYIDNILEAKKIFGKELWGTLYTIAKDVKIQVEFNPTKVKAYRLIGYENRMLNKEDFNDDKKDAGDIGCGHTVTALYEIIPADSDEKISNVDPLEYQKNVVSGSKNLMTLKLRYKLPQEETSKLIVKKLSEDEIKLKNISGNLKFALAVAEFGMILRESEFKGSSSYKNILSLAQESKGDDKDGYRTEFIKLVETAELLSR